MIFMKVMSKKKFKSRDFVETMLLLLILLLLVLFSK